LGRLEVKEAGDMAELFVKLPGIERRWLGELRESALNRRR
jgi:hypothetical protein